ncbi:MAG: hypothetical protein RLZZ524_1429 [Pseudomonadota bacterium]
MAGALEIARRALDELGFFSKALEEAKGAKMKEGSVQQWKNVLQKQGVKPAELDATGFNALNPNEKLNRDDVINYFTENRVKLGEKKYGEDPSNPSPNRIWEQARSDMDRLNDDIAREVERNGGQMNERAYELQRQYTQAEQRMWDASDQIERASAAEPRFEGYTLPGGANYQERVLTLPPRQEPRFRVYREGEPFSEYSYKKQEDAAEYARAMSERHGIPHTVQQDMVPGQAQFRHETHWPGVDNPLAHYRTKERLGPNGERVLHIDEIQSDWAQQGRDRGFKDPKAAERMAAIQKEYDLYDQQMRELMPQRGVRQTDLEAKVRADLGLPRHTVDMTPEQAAQYWAARDELVFNDPVLMDLNERYANANLERSRRREAIDGLMGQAGGLPAAPFVTQTKDWTDLTLKRAMIEAERGGYDAVAWTPGMHHAERYDLSSRVGKINYFPNQRELRVFDHEGNILHQGQHSPEELGGVLGKDNAQRLLTGSKLNENKLGDEDFAFYRLEPDDMTWGGEGMKAYYDKIVPDRLTKLARTLDPEARIESMPAGYKTSLESSIDDAGEMVGGARVYEQGQSWGTIGEQPGRLLREFPTYEQATEFTDMAHWPRGGPAPQLPMLRLTPRMREEIQKGLPLFVGAPVVAGGALSALNQEQAPMANEFARGGPVREQREQERWQDIERLSPSDEMLRDSAYRYYMPAYDRLLATRPIGGTDAYRLPPVRRFADGGEAERMSAGAEIGSLYDAGNRDIAAMGGLEQFGSGNYYSGEGFGGSGSLGAGIGFGNSGIGFGADDGGYSFAQAGQDIGNAFNFGNQQIEAMGGLEQFSDPNFYSGEGYANPDDMLGPMPAPAPAPQMSVGPLYAAPPPAPDIPEPGFTGVGGDIMSGLGIGPAPAFNVSEPLGGLGLNYFDPTPVAQQNVDLAAGIADNNAFDPNLSGPSSQFNAPMRDNLIDIAASTGITPLGSPTDYEDAPDRGFRGMQLSNIAADDPFASFPGDDLTDRGFRGQPVEGMRAVDTSMPAGMVGNAASSKAAYDMPTGMVPLSPMTPDRIARVLDAEIDPRGVAKSMREKGMTLDEARRYEARPIVESLINRRATTGIPIEQQLEQYKQYTSVPGNATRNAGRFPGDIDRMQPSQIYEQVTTDILRDMSLGNRQYANAYNYGNPNVKGVSGWVGDMARQPGTVEIGVAPFSHVVGNVDNRAITRPDLVGDYALPAASAINPNPQPAGQRRADADIPELDPFATERSIMSELFGINPAMAQPVTAAGTPAAPRDPSTIPEIDIWAGEKAFGRSVFGGMSDAIRSITGTSGDPTDPANAALPPANYDPFSAVDIKDTTRIGSGNALVDGLVRAGPGIAASWPSDAMAGRYSELGNLGDQPLTAAAYRSAPAAEQPAVAAAQPPTEQPAQEPQVVPPDDQDAAARERAAAVAAVTAAGGSANTNRYNVDPLTGRMYDNVTGDRIINPNYISRTIDALLGFTPLGLPNGALALAGGVTGYPLSAGQLMALGRPGTPLENAGAGGTGDANGNYGSYGEGAAGRDPPGVQSAYIDPAAPVAGSSSGGGGALSLIAAAPPTPAPLPLPTQVGRRYLGEDSDPRTYGMRAQRRYYGDA